MTTWREDRLRRSSVPMRVGRDSPEQIQRSEVSRALRKINLSPEEEEAIERLSRSLVGKLLHGPISRVMACA